MLNPLALLSPELIVSLQQHGFIAFVRQSYPRGKTPGDSTTKEALLVTPYKELDLAYEHLSHIAADHRKFIYHTTNPEEIKMLTVAALQPAGYKVYVALLKDKKWKVGPILQPKLKRYLQSNTKWKVKDGAISADIRLHFGEFMVRLENPSGEMEVPLSELEKE